MPLSLSRPGEQGYVKKVGGREENRQFLASLGFVPGSRITVINEMGGNLIVSVKESRVAISREMAASILV